MNQALVPLSDDQLDRYARHLVLKEIGGAGQAKLRAAHVLVIGAGGIGSPVLHYLAAAGIGHITLVDDDRVSLSNLQRQVLFGTEDIGAYKVGIAAVQINRINPDVAVTAKRARIGPDNAAEMMQGIDQGIDIVIDGSDNFATRLVVADTAYAARIPLVSAAIGQFHGQLGTWRGWEEGKPCYRCFVGDAYDAEDCDSCSEVGVLGAMVGLMGSFAAMEVIRQIVGFGEDQAGKLQIFEGLAPSMRSIKMPKDPGCKTCGTTVIV
jgi:molybdopterin-synthase adenylyltransferase